MFQQFPLHEKTATQFSSRILPALALLLSSVSFAHAQQEAIRANRLSPVFTSSAIQDEQDAHPLERGKPIKRNLAGGQAHIYRLTLETNQYLYLSVEQLGIDVAVRLVGPDGKEIIEVDNKAGPKWTEYIKLITQRAGEYRLEVRAGKSAAAGNYEVKIEDLRPAVAQDQNRIAAYQLYLEGARLISKGTTEAQRSAIPKFEAMLPLLQAAGERGEGTDALETLVILHRELGETKKTLEHFERWRMLLREMGDRAKEARTLLSICYYHKELDEYQEALDCLNNRTLPLFREIKDRRGEAGTLATVGLIYNNLNEYQKALDFNNEALLLSRAEGDRNGEALALGNLGAIYNGLGESQKAIDYFAQALPQHRAAGSNNVAFTLHNLGTAYRALGEYQQALDHFNQALPLFRGMLYRLGEASTLYNTGIVYKQLGDYPKALDYFTQAFTIFKDLHSPKGEARVLTNLGGIHLSTGEHEKALGEFDQALQLFRRIRDVGGEAHALYSLSRSEREAGRLSAARAHIEAALEIVESLRAKIVSQELRTSYFASVRSYYEFYVDLLMRMHQLHPAEGHDATALQASERARARSLLELLNEAGADIRQGVEPALLERERNLQQLLNGAAARQIRLLSKTHTKEQAGEAVKELAALTTEYEQVRAQIRAHSPRYAALTQPQPLSLKEIQTRVLDSDTLLLEFALGEDRSYMWAVTPTSLVSFELPERLKIETAARRVYQLLTARNKRVQAETTEQRRARITQADADYPIAAAALSQMLLGSVASQLGNKRLLIVADGALSYVPFAALPMPLRMPNLPAQVRQPPLLVEHEVVALPSASTLAVLRREVEGRRPAAKAVAVLADPVFDKDDERVQVNIARSGSGRPANPTAQTAFSRDVVRAMEDVSEAESLQRLPRLYNTRSEAEVINTLVSRKESLQALDFAANRATATSPELGQYRIVHFATHAFANDVHPELSGIVLSLVDQKGHPQDGFLRTNEIFNLKLPAELVVLSACRTGLGKEVKGEGLIGLTRGFMYAGTPRVLVSLWSLSDKPTAELMARLYKKMLGAGRLTPAAALRAAQVEMWTDKRWEQPYFWAGFVLQGEWR